MATQNKKQEKNKKKTRNIFVKGAYIFARFNWFFGIIIAVIVLLSLYLLIIQPQYQNILNRQEEIRQLNLEGERERLREHIVSLERFIMLTNEITEEEKFSLNKLLSNVPDLLILQIQFEKLMEQYEAEDIVITFGEPAFFELEEDELVVEEERDRIINLSSFFEASQDGEVLKDDKKTAPEITLGEIPINISLTFADYFKAKDFLKDIEQLVPLVDIENISFSVAQPELVVVKEISDEEESIGSQAGATSLTLSGVIQIATMK